MLQMRDVSFHPDPGAASRPGSQPADPAGALIDAEGYARWLLPPEPLVGPERAMQWCSRAAGALAFAGGIAGVWLIL